MQNLTSTAAWLASEVDKINDGELFEIMSADSKKGLPLVAWRIKKENVGYDEFAIAGHLRKRGWIVPAYQMAPNAHDVRSGSLLRRLGSVDLHFWASDIAQASASSRSRRFQS